MQPNRLTPIMQLSVTAAALVVAASAVVFAVVTWSQKRNADLVGIGVGVLRVDPEEEEQVGAAREWALDLIDANAGGVTFSTEARVELLNSPLVFGSSGGTPGTGTTYTYTPVDSADTQGPPKNSD